MEIKIDKLHEGENGLIISSEEIKSSRIGDIEVTESQDLPLTINKSGNYLHINGSNTVKYISVCDRCAENYEAEQIINIDYFFHIGDMTSSKPDDIEIIHPDENNGILDFSRYFREAFFLAQPFSSLCSSDCKGLCSKCGKNLNEGQCGCQNEEKTDPRWEKLNEILKKNK